MKRHDQNITNLQGRPGIASSIWLPLCNALGLQAKVIRAIQASRSLSRGLIIDAPDSRIGPFDNCQRNDGGRTYPVSRRGAIEGGDLEQVFDTDVIKGAELFIILGAFEPWDNDSQLAVNYQLIGDEESELHLIKLLNGCIFWQGDRQVDRVVWIKDSKALYFIGERAEQRQFVRSSWLFLTDIRETIIFEEANTRLGCTVHRSCCWAWIFIDLHLLHRENKHGDHPDTTEDRRNTLVSRSPDSPTSAYWQPRFSTPSAERIVRLYALGTTTVVLSRVYPSPEARLLNVTVAEIVNAAELLNSCDVKIGQSVVGKCSSPRLDSSDASINYTISSFAASGTVNHLDTVRGANVPADALLASPFLVSNYQEPELKPQAADDAEVPDPLGTCALQQPVARLANAQSRRQLRTNKPGKFRSEARHSLRVAARRTTDGVIQSAVQSYHVFWQDRWCHFLLRSHLQWVRETLRRCSQQKRLFQPPCAVQCLSSISRRMQIGET